MKKFKLIQDVPKEYEEQKALAKYLDGKGVLWTASMVGVKANPVIWNTMKAVGVKTGFPDILIFEPIGKYCGLAIELKRRDWTKPSTDREKEQEILLGKLKERGWCVSFQAGATNAIKEIERYFNKTW